MPYSEKEYQVSNVNYLNKDFSGLKSSLIEYAKTYFPNTYRDFNETSPGMMLIEMAAYVGDVLSFYVDNQYKEMLLPLAEERRNVINMANMFGYKVKSASPAYADITITQTIGTTGDVDNIIPDYSDAQIIDKGLKITSGEDSSIIFETLDVVDFTVSGTFDTAVEVNDTDLNGVVTEYKLTRKVKAIGAETKTTTFSIGSPEKFKRITLPENNIVEIVNVTDSNGNKWYEVDYLAQDRVPFEVHYNSDDRVNAYGDIGGTQDEASELVAVPYTLQYIKTSKRFITEINSDNTTSLVFGNGILHTSVTGSLNNGFHQTQQVGITIPGETENITSDISPVIAGVGTSLGESPSNTTLTITYRVGGGISSNVTTNDLTLLNNGVTRIVNGNSVTPVVTNELPARGGSDGETIEEIRKRAQSNLLTQRRCVTREDYEARVLTMPAKYGNIAKVSVNRMFDENFQPSSDTSGGINYQKLQNIMQTILDSYNAQNNGATMDVNTLFENIDIRDDGIVDRGDVSAISELQSFFENIPINTSGLATIEVYTLSYDNNKNLVSPPDILMNNLRNYLNEFRMISDEFVIYPGKVVNFGVAFEVTSHRHANKHDVKLRCINKIIDYFNVDKLQFRQPIYTSDLIYELMGIDGVRSVNNLELTQGSPSGDWSTVDFGQLYSQTVDAGSGKIVDDGTGYGYEYEFHKFYDGTISSDGTILPSVEPSIFELKNPNINVKGVVL